MSLGWIISVSVWSGIQATMFLVSWGLRNHKVWQVRNYHASMLLAFGFFAMFILINLNEYLKSKQSSFCNLLSISSMALTIGLFATLRYRGAHFLCLAHEKYRTSWFWSFLGREKNFFKSFGFLATLIESALVMSYYLVMAFYVDTTWKKDGQCSPYQPFKAGAGPFAYYALFAVLLARNIIRIKDVYFIYFELGALILLLVSYTLIVSYFAVMLVSRSNDGDSPSKIYAILLSTIFCLCQIFVLGLPSILIMRESSPRPAADFGLPKNIPPETTRELIIRMLGQDPPRDLVFAAARSIFSIELPIFVLDVESFRSAVLVAANETDPDLAKALQFGLLEKADCVINNYLQEGCIFEVNLAASAVLAVKQKMTKMREVLQERKFGLSLHYRDGPGEGELNTESVIAIFEHLFDAVQTSAAKLLWQNFTSRAALKPRDLAWLDEWVSEWVSEGQGARVVRAEEKKDDTLESALGSILTSIGERSQTGGEEHL